MHWLAQVILAFSALCAVLLGFGFLMRRRETASEGLPHQPPFPPPELPPPPPAAEPDPTRIAARVAWYFIESDRLCYIATTDQLGFGPNRAEPSIMTQIVLGDYVLEAASVHRLLVDEITEAVSVPALQLLVKVQHAVGTKLCYYRLERL